MYNLFSPPHSSPLTNSKGVPECYSTPGSCLILVVLARRKSATMRLSTTGGGGGQVFTCGKGGGAFTHV